MRRLRFLILVFISTAVAAGLSFLPVHATVPQVASNTWAAAGDLISARTGAAAALLDNVDVLVIGGGGGTQDVRLTLTAAR